MHAKIWQICLHLVDFLILHLGGVKLHNNVTYKNTMAKLHNYNVTYKNRRVVLINLKVYDI